MTLFLKLRALFGFLLFPNWYPFPVPESNSGCHLAFTHHVSLDSPQSLLMPQSVLVLYYFDTSEEHRYSVIAPSV